MRGWSVRFVRIGTIICITANNKVITKISIPHSIRSEDALCIVRRQRVDLSAIHIVVVVVVAIVRMIFCIFFATQHARNDDASAGRHAKSTHDAPAPPYLRLSGFVRVCDSQYTHRDTQKTPQAVHVADTHAHTHTHEHLCITTYYICISLRVQRAPKRKMQIIDGFTRYEKNDDRGWWNGTFVRSLGKCVCVFK